MRSPRRPDPPPLRTDDRLVAAAGTVAWAVALVVLLIIGLPEDARWWLWVCVCGIACGLFGYWYAGNSWTVEAESLATVNLVEGGDWVGFFATLGEEVIQLFLGFTSGQ